MSWQPHATFNGVIDVSHHNGAIDWPKVAASGIALAFIKATQGAEFVDPTFAANWTSALGAGLMVIPYHFLTEQPPAEQLANLQRILSPGHGPVMIDWEYDEAEGRRASIATMEVFAMLVATATHRLPVAYHGMFDLSSPAINALPWMIPKWGSQPQGPRWLFWQDRPNLTVPGISTPADHSIFAGAADELKAWYVTGGMPAGF